jgi:hypothetical protein
MSMMLRILALLPFVYACLAADGPAILERRCLSCHNDSARMGNLSLTTRANAAGVLDGKLLQRVTAGQMPPGGGLAAEEKAELATWIAGGAKWERTLGVPQRPRAGKDWWSLQPIRPQKGSIDAFVDAALKQKGLRRNAPAAKRALLRRVTFDLTGLPPSPADIVAFESDSSPDAYEQLVDRLLASPAYGERWGRHWLDVIRYGESNGYEQNHTRMNAWPFRDYVIRAFNQDLPFDRFILQQLAGDVVSKGNPYGEVATGFLVAGPHDTVGNQNEAARRQQRADDLDDIVNATASAFLGLTVNCARCHDHKFDPILQKDYYRLAAVFNGVTHGERDLGTAEQHAAFRAQAEPLEQAIAAAKAKLVGFAEAAKDGRPAAEARLRARMRPAPATDLTEEVFRPTQARFVRFRTPVAMNAGLDEFEILADGGRNVALTAEVQASSTRVADGSPDAYHVRYVHDGKFDKRWFPVAGQPASLTFDLKAVESIARVAWSVDRKRAFQGRFQPQPVTRYTLEVSLDGKDWKTLATGDDRLPPRKEDLDRLIVIEALDESARAEYQQTEKELARLEGELRRVPKLPTVYAGKMKQPEEPVYLLKGGNVMARGEAVAPASLDALEGFSLPVDAPEGERRVAFARWLGNDKNPLTPRVIVNRLWHYHFGRGLVGTPSDFGYNGERPTHPELLDYLAGRLLANGWRLKPLHREILLSQAYRQSSEWNAEAARVDADSRLLWRFPPQRLEAEALRDSMLQVAGVLKTSMGGPSFRLYKYTVDNVATYFPMDQFDASTYRRTVYAESARSIRTELLSVFDCPDSSLPEPRRVVTTSPLQALSLLNHSFTIDMAEAFAKRLTAEASDGPGRIERAFVLAFGRTPTAEESASAADFVRTHGLPALARALFNANEFLYVH